MTELVITRGLPASGKTTLALARVAQDPQGWARVNKDSIRAMMHGGTFIKPSDTGAGTEAIVNIGRDSMIRDLLHRGVNVINDDTNLPLRTVRDLRRIAWLEEAGFEVVDLTNVPPEICRARNALRVVPDRVPDAVITDMHERFIKGKPWPLPLPPEHETDPLADPGEPYLPRIGAPYVYLVDVDGTVALRGTRSAFDEHLVHTDRPNHDVVELVRNLAEAHNGTNIVFLSARSEKCRESTEAWLRKNVIPSWRELFMRPADDGRPDFIVKREIFNTYIRHNMYVEGIVDDRKQVVKMWRAMNLTVFHCADGDY